MNLDDQLARLAKSPKFQEKVRLKRISAEKSGKTFGQAIMSGKNGSGIGFGSGIGPGVGAGNTATAILAQLKVYDILVKVISAIQTRIKSFPSEIDLAFRIYPMGINKEGQSRYVIFFDPDAIHRESLYHEGYPDGMENIVALFSHGSKLSKNPVWNRASFEYDYNTHRQYGEYRLGRHIFIPKGSYVEPDPFLIDEIYLINRELNAEGTKVILHTKYYP